MFLIKKKIFAICKKDGFTLIEMMISVAIITAISTQVLISFSSLNDSSNLTRAAQDFAFNIRRAQAMSLAVAPVTIDGTLKIPQAVGIYVSSKPSFINGNLVYNYLFFADQNNNKKYDASPSSEQIESATVLPNTIRIVSITGENLFSPGAHIIFYTPEATVAMTNHESVQLSDVVDIVLKGVTGVTKTVRVRMSGQVTVL